jgi:hypothetical protein
MAVRSQEAFLVDVALDGDELRSDPANYQDCSHLSGRGNDLVAGVFADAMTLSLD